MSNVRDAVPPRPVLLLPMALISGAVLVLAQVLFDLRQPAVAALGLAVAACQLFAAAAALRGGRLPAGPRLMVSAAGETYLAIQLGIALFAYPGTIPWPNTPAAVLAPVVLASAWLLPEPAHRRIVVIGYYIAVVAPAIVVVVARGTAAAGNALTATAPLVVMSVVLHAILRELTALEKGLVTSHGDRETLERLAHTDALTELPNRRAVLAELNREAAVSARFGLPLAVIEFDLDHFKEINDVYGHQTGDRVLAAVARHVQRRLRATDMIGRLGGEEFLILAPGNGLADATRLAEELCRSLREHPMAGDRGWVTASFGVAVYEPGDTGDAILARADQALYAAKRDGRDRVAVEQRNTSPSNGRPVGDAFSRSSSP